MTRDSKTNEAEVARDLAHEIVNTLAPLTCKIAFGEGRGGGEHSAHCRATADKIAAALSSSSIAGEDAKSRIHDNLSAAEHGALNRDWPNLTSEEKRAFNSVRFANCTFCGSIVEKFYRCHKCGKVFTPVAPPLPVPTGGEDLASHKFDSSTYLHLDDGPRVPRATDEELRESAHETVQRIRGSWDAPGFDACVTAEYNRLVAERSRHVTPIQTESVSADIVERVARAIFIRGEELQKGESWIPTDQQWESLWRADSFRQQRAEIAKAALTAARLSLPIEVAREVDDDVVVQVTLQAASDLLRKHAERSNTQWKPKLLWSAKQIDEMAALYKSLPASSPAPGKGE